MSEIIKSYRQDVPALRFIGVKYLDSDRIDGSFSHLWNEWFENGRFHTLETLPKHEYKKPFDAHDAYISLMRVHPEEPFEYWIGMFLPENTDVPEGFEHRDFPATKLGVCWVYGKNDDVFRQEERCWDILRAEGFETLTDGEGATWFFERYACPRFTSPDDKGKIILDVCFYVSHHRAL